MTVDAEVVTFPVELGLPAKLMAVAAPVVVGPLKVNVTYELFPEEPLHACQPVKAFWIAVCCSRVKSFGLITTLRLANLGQAAPFVACSIGGELQPV
jgi:hypothetical protein